MPLKFLGTSMFIDNLCTINDDGEFSSYLHVPLKFHGTSGLQRDFCTKNDGGEFSSSHKYDYPKQLERKPEHQGEHATFLDFEIPIQDNIFACKLEKRSTFPLFIIRMPYLSSNIPSSIFCRSIFSGFQSIGN